MAFGLRGLGNLGAVLLVVSFVVVMFVSFIGSEISDADLPMFSDSTIGRDFHGYRRLLDCPNCNDEENVDITATYSDASGTVRIHKIKSNDLSSSWVWASSADEDLAQYSGVQEQKGFSEQDVSRSQNGDVLLPNKEQQTNPIDPVKLKRQVLRQRRREQRAAELIQVSEDAELQMQAAAIERSRQFKNINRGKYSIWRREYQSPNSDSTLKLMKDQIIMAKVYASIARSKKNFELADSLMECIRQNQMVIGEANSDAALHWSAATQAKIMGHRLSLAKDMLYECDDVARKLRVMIQSTEENINALKKQSTFLIQHAAKTMPRPLHCLPLQLTTDYFFYNYGNTEMADKGKLVDPSLYHYAIFSDNVLATSVVVNSTASHAKEPEKHVFHIVTDKLNFAAMKMWFILHPPLHATVDVENIDSFKWLNSSYCSVLRQLESSRLKEYYFKAHHPSSLSAGNENLKYRNPKYLSMLNHLRFYMPEVYPKLEKILFLDDDVVVQKDLTPLWYIDMKGMVNGAVETCKESFHRFDTYLNFSNPKISQNFDPQACGWAFGMNMFDLKEWTKRNITGIYHYWQDLNEDRTLWKLGSLPPGLITFYNLTYPLDRNWHVLGLGYDPAINPSDIESAAVIHYNGNYKPWLDLAVSKYKPYWSKDLVIRGCESEHQWQYIISHYHEIRKVTLLPDNEIVPPVFKACAHLQSVNHGISLHADVLKLGFNSIMNFYIKCGMMGSASCLFAGMVNKDSVSWNSVIHGFLSNGDAEIGLDMYLHARVSSFKANVASLVLVLQACWKLGVITEGLNIHCLVIKNGFAHDLSIQNALMSLYSKFEDLEAAQKMFDEMPLRDVISWSVLISAYAQVGEFLNALQLFREMSMDAAIGLDGLVAIAVIQACGGAGDLRQGMSVHGHLISRGFETDMFVGNSLIDMYSKCLDVDSAHTVFDQMLQKNNVSWNSMLSGLVHNEKYLEALQLFDQMKMDGLVWDEVTLVSLLQACKKVGESMWSKCIHSVIIRQLLDPNEMVLNSLLDSYAKFELMEVALRLFNSMKRINLISWSTMITGYANIGWPEEAIAFFREMQLAQVKPNTVIVLSLLEACAVLAELKLSKSTHAIALRNNLAKDIAISTSLINAYAKCGHTDLSKRVFDKMSERNTLTWNAMISALGMNGSAREALSLLNQMESSSVKPNGVTMLSVLSACSHGGLVQEGLNCFQRMIHNPMLQPNVEHYSCIVDMLGRAGDLQNAAKIIRLMPEGLEAGAAAWGALLSACKRHGDGELGREAALHVMELEPMSPAGYLLSSNMYARTGFQGDMVKMRALMRERGVRDGNGYSLVHVGQKAHRFVAWDACHSQCREVYCMVEFLHGLMKREVETEEIVLEFDWDQ